MSKEINFFLLVVAVAAFALLVVPSPEFPMNDEWMFSRSVNKFFETGVITCDGCTTSGVLLVSMGIASAKIFGFSFEALRYIVVLFGILSVAVTYLLLKEITKNRKLSLLGSMFLLANPIFYNTSHLFTTDVPFLFFVVLSVFFAVKAISGKQQRYFLFCALSVSAAILLRQFAIAIPAGILIYYLLSNRKMILRPPVITAILLPILVMGVFVLNQIQATGKYYSQEFDVKNPVGLSKEGVYYFWSTSIYSGFFFAPLAFVSYRYIRNKTFLGLLIFFAATAIAAALFLAGSFPQTGSMPYLGNILNKNGLGTVTIPGQEGKAEYFPQTFWILVTAISIVSVSVIFTEIISKVRKINFRGPEFFLIVIVGIFLLSALTKVGGFYDRYTLVFIPLLGFVLLEKLRSKTLQKISIAFLMLLVSFSFVAELDYVNWDKVRWQEISELESQGAQKENINGGFEFCLYNYGMKHVYDYWKQIGVFDSPGIRPHDWKFCPGDQYVISFSENPKDLASEKRYVTQKTVDYCLYGNFLCGRIFVLKAI